MNTKIEASPCPQVVLAFATALLKVSARPDLDNRMISNTPGAATNNGPVSGESNLPNEK